MSFGAIKVEDSPEPELLITAVEPCPTSSASTTPLDPKDPQGFLKRCSGYNKKTRVRCSAVIGKKSQQNTHPTYLPTCSAHRDQQTYAGWCQLRKADGETCGKLFRWTPPYFELCLDHQGHPDTPCYFFKLPLELRHEVFRYLLPTRPIGSSTAVVHDGQRDGYDPGHHSRRTTTAVNQAPGQSFYGRPGSVGSHIALACGGPSPSRLPDSHSLFPVPLLDLYLVNHQTYLEVKDLLYSIASFTIDIRKDGTFMCGRRLLEPTRADGVSHSLPDEADGAKETFLKAFDWAAVKNYSVDVLLENGPVPHPSMATNSGWDEEVEIYDIRDYVSVVVSGVLAKSKNLCKLQVRLCMADFDWSEEQILTNTKLLVSPFERLRNVRQPQITGVFFGRPNHNSMITSLRPQRQVMKRSPTPPPICSVPSLPIHTPVLIPGMPAFDEYSIKWSRWLSSRSSTPVTLKPPIRSMFTEFKDFYTKLSYIVSDIAQRHGRHAFLHRARVAREQEDVESFRHLRNELIQYWYMYVDQEERKKADMHARLSKMLDADIYPSHEWEPDDSARRNSPLSQGSAQSPVLLNADTLEKEGIPMTGNQRRSSTPHFPYHRSHPLSQYQTQQQARQQMQRAQMVAAQQNMQGPSQMMARQMGAQQTMQAQQIRNMQLQAQAQARQAQQMQSQQRSLQQQAQRAQQAQQDQQIQYSAQMNGLARPAILNVTLPAMQTSHNSNAGLNNDNWELYAPPDSPDSDAYSSRASFGSALVNGTFEWSGRADGPGPSTKKRRSALEGDEEEEHDDYGELPFTIAEGMNVDTDDAGFEVLGERETKSINNLLDATFANVVEKRLEEAFVGKGKGKGKGKVSAMAPNVTITAL